MISKDLLKVLYRIKIRINKYYEESTSYKDIYVSDINDKFIEIKNKADRVCVKIEFSDLFNIYGNERFINI